MGGRGPTSHATQTALSSNGIVFARNRERERETNKRRKTNHKRRRKKGIFIRVVVRFFVFFPCRSTGFSLSLSPFRQSFIFCLSFDPLVLVFRMIASSTRDSYAVRLKRIERGKRNLVKCCLVGSDLTFDAVGLFSQ